MISECIAEYKSAQINNSLYEEVVQHTLFCQKKVEVFHGRKETLKVTQALTGRCFNCKILCNTVIRTRAHTHARTHTHTHTHMHTYITYIHTHTNKQASKQTNTTQTQSQTQTHKQVTITRNIPPLRCQGRIKRKPEEFTFSDSQV